MFNICDIKRTLNRHSLCSKVLSPSTGFSSMADVNGRPTWTSWLTSSDGLLNRHWEIWRSDKESPPNAVFIIRKVFTGDSANFTQNPMAKLCSENRCIVATARETKTSTTEKDVVARRTIEHHRRLRGRVPRIVSLSRFQPNRNSAMANSYLKLNRWHYYFSDKPWVYYNTEQYKVYDCKTTAGKEKKKEAAYCLKLLVCVGGVEHRLNVSVNK